MGYWKKKTKPLVNDKVVTSVMKPLVVVDGGAANSVFEPLDVVERAVVYLFDPNPVLNMYARDGFDIRKHPAGLWSCDETVTLHIAEKPSTSSVYPPHSELLKRFPDSIGEPARRTVKKEVIPGVALDTVVAELDKGVGGGGRFS
jgi:hypothetical protein